MTLLLRILLIIVSVLFFFITVRRIRKSSMRIEDAVFWVLLSIVLVIFALFPAAADFLAHIFGIYSTVNFLFLFMIFVLLSKLFSMSVQLAQLEKKLTGLAQKQALDAAAVKNEDAAGNDSKGITGETAVFAGGKEF